MEMRLDQSKTPFSLDFTLQCGQAFRWKKIGKWWYGVVHQNVVKVRQNGDVLEFQTCTQVHSKKGHVATTGIAYTRGNAAQRMVQAPS